MEILIERIKILLALFENFSTECRKIFDGENKKNEFFIHFDDKSKDNNYYSIISYGDSYGMFRKYIKIIKIENKKTFILELDSFHSEVINSKNNLFYSEKEEFLD